MKRTKILSTLLIFMLLLCACSQTGQSNPTQTGGLGNNRQGGELPVGMELAIGTLALDKTSAPIDAKEAADLLFLWKGMALLLKDTTAAKEEVQGLLTQIQEKMTPDQIQAIKDMHLTYQNAAQIGGQYGLRLGSGGNGNGTSQYQGRSGTPTPRQGSQGGYYRGGSRIPGISGGGGMRLNNNNNNQTRIASPFQGTGLTTQIVNAVVQYLESKVKQ